MANIFSNLMNTAGDWLAQKIAPYINDALGLTYNVLGNYYTGDHRPQLKTKVGQVNDNIVQNFVGLAVDRSVSRLFKGGVQFILPEGADAQQEYLDRVWDLNKKEIILYQVALHGAVYGTTYFKIVPDGVMDNYTGQWYPRLIPIDPEIIRFKTDPEDMNEVEEYKIEYKTKREDGRGGVWEVAHREITRHAEVEDYNEPEIAQERAETTWVIEKYEQVGGGVWTLIDKTEWPYNFPPIIHWKNLPSLKVCYGDSDIDDAINVQDKSNFVQSNTGKIIKFHANPTPVIVGVSSAQVESVDAAIGKMMVIPNPDAKVSMLEAQSDLASSVAFGNNMRQSIFDIAREVDISSMADKVGSLTNFGLQILWADAIDKNDTKRQLYGDALLELNRRLLVLAGFEWEASDPGYVQWGNPLPMNIMEEMQADKLALELGIIDKETVASRYEFRYGVDWETIEANIEEEKASANKNNANIGAEILRRFSQGQGVEMTPQEKEIEKEKEV